jgi:hypothetical protein
MKHFTIAACAAVLLLVGASDASAFTRGELVLFPCASDGRRSDFQEGYYCPGFFISDNGSRTTIDVTMQSDHGYAQSSEVRAYNWGIGTEVTCAGISGAITAINPDFATRISLRSSSGVELSNVFLSQCAAWAP